MEVLKIKGLQHKTMLAKDGKVKIIREGTLFAAKREKVIPASNIAGVEVKKPGALISGYIQIQIAGMSSGSSSFTYTGGTYDAVQDENAVVFTDKDSYQTALAIQKHILEFNANSGVSSASASAADEIAKFKKLLDDGVITKEEFEVKKRQLLGL